MKVLAGGRQTGRTTRLIEMAAEAEMNHEVCYIVSANEREARNLFQKAKELFENGSIPCMIGFPITYNEFLQNRYAGQNIHKLYVDNAERLLQELTHIRIEAMTVTVE